MIRNGLLGAWVLQLQAVIRHWRGGKAHSPEYSGFGEKTSGVNASLQLRGRSSEIIQKRCGACNCKTTLAPQPNDQGCTY